MSHPYRVSVVVPARNEEDTLGECLDAIDRAVAAAVGSGLVPGCRVVVALDACTDGSARIVASRPWVDSLELDAGCVGAARNAGVRMAAALAGPGDPERHWVAMTDADTWVPPGWLLTHLHFAGRVEVLTGTVEPAEDDLDPEVLARWRGGHRLAENHGHVHGANLGFTVAAFDRIGGFPQLSLHEDVAFVQRARAAGVRSYATDQARVRTSGRCRGRASGGFAAYLGGLT